MSASLDKETEALERVLPCFFASLPSATPATAAAVETSVVTPLTSLPTKCAVEPSSNQVDLPAPFVLSVPSEPTAAVSAPPVMSATHRRMALLVTTVTASLALAGIVWTLLHASANSAHTTVVAAADISTSRPFGPQAERYYRRANALLAAQRPALALAELQRAVALDPSYGAAYRSLGVAYMLLGREREAIDAYERFVLFSPHHYEAPGLRQLIADYRRNASSPVLR